MRDWETVLRWQHKRPERYDHHEQIIFSWTQGEYEGPPTNARDFISWLQELVQEVPTEYQDRVYIELDSEVGWESTSSARMKVAYRRPETDEELGARQAEYDAALLAKEQDERATFATLKAKFEGN